MTELCDWTPLGAKLAIRCPGCGAWRRCDPSWPDEAWFRIDDWGEVLWAWDRSTLESLIRYVVGSDRAFLMKVPTHFLKAKARDAVLKKLRKLAGVSA